MVKVRYTVIDVSILGIPWFIHLMHRILTPTISYISSFNRMLSPATLSILNLLTFTLNTLETSGVGPFSIHFRSDQDNASISQKYQTIITPHGIAFSIWGIIFFMEALFVLITLVKKDLRGSVLVVDGVSCWFVLG